MVDVTTSEELRAAVQNPTGDTTINLVGGGPFDLEGTAIARSLTITSSVEAGPELRNINVTGDVDVAISNVTIGDIASGYAVNAGATSSIALTNIQFQGDLFVSGADIQNLLIANSNIRIDSNAASNSFGSAVFGFENATLTNNTISSGFPSGFNGSSSAFYFGRSSQSNPDQDNTVSITGNSISGLGGETANIPVFNLNNVNGVVGGDGASAGNTFTDVGIGVLIFGDSGTGLRVAGNTFRGIVNQQVNASADGTSTATGVFLANNGTGIVTIERNQFIGNASDIRTSSFGGPGNPTSANTVVVGNAFGLNAVQNNVALQFDTDGGNTFNGVAFTQGLFGTSSADIVATGAGDQFFRGGAGNDQLNGGAGAGDQASYSGVRSNYAITMNSDGSYTIADTRAGGGDGVDTLTRIESVIFADGSTIRLNTVDTPVTPPSTVPSAGPDNIVGTASPDVISAGAGNDTVTSGAGNDSVNGNQGDDSIDGGAGNDFIQGGQGNDRLFGGADNDIVYGDLGDDVINGNQGNDQVNGNVGNDQVSGGQGNDTISGGQGNDALFGDLGNDLLSGDLGNDTMTGGAGSDVFEFRLNQGNDVITDFDGASGDRLSLFGQTYTTIEANGSTTVALSGGGTIVLTGVTGSEFDASFIV